MKNVYTVCFDGACDLCGEGVKFLKRHLPPDEAVYEPLQDSGTLARLGMTAFDPLTEMKVITAEGEVLGGPEAVRFLGRRIWWLRPLMWLSRVPGVRWVFDRVYWLIALNRHRLGCRIEG